MMQVAVIDDNPTNVLLMERMLDRVEGCTPVNFTDPAKALAWCQTSEVDLVLVDYMMPDIDGISFIHQFRAMPEKKDIPIIMVTADSNKEVRYDALQAGATDFLTKPVDKTEFLARIANMLALRKNQKQLTNRAEWLSEAVQKATAKLRLREQEALFLLSKAAEYRDPETGAHIIRMSHYAKIITRNLGLPEAAQDIVFEASPMHDVGKVGTPDNILLKPGKLDDEEFAIMKKHANYGCEILNQGTSNLMKTAAEIAITHHEKFNGKGYPNGLKGKDIPLYGRIVAVADVFDALTSTRPYKKAWPVEKAVALLEEERGEHFDPVCVDALLKSMDEVLEIMQKNQDADLQ